MLGLLSTYCRKELKVTQNLMPPCNCDCKEINVWGRCKKKTDTEFRVGSVMECYNLTLWCVQITGLHQPFNDWTTVSDLSRTIGEISSTSELIISRTVLHVINFRADFVCPEFSSVHGKVPRKSWRCSFTDGQRSNGHTNGLRESRMP